MHERAQGHCFSSVQTLLLLFEMRSPHVRVPLLPETDPAQNKTGVPHHGLHQKHHLEKCDENVGGRTQSF